MVWRPGLKRTANAALALIKALGGQLEHAEPPKACKLLAPFRHIPERAGGLLVGFGAVNAYVPQNAVISVAQRPALLSEARPLLNHAKDTCPPRAASLGDILRKLAGP